MIRLLAALLLWGCALVAAAAQVNPWGIVQPNGYQQITSLSASTALTIPDGTSYAVVCIETAAVRWRDDGVAPTASVGQPLAIGQCIAYPAPSPNLRFIQSASNAVLNASYYK